MIHQPLGGARGQAADIEIQAKVRPRMHASKLHMSITSCTHPTHTNNLLSLMLQEILFVRAQINAYIAEFTDQVS